MPPASPSPNVITILAAGMGTDGLVNVRGSQGVRITSGPPLVPPTSSDSTDGVEVIASEAQKVPEPIKRLKDSGSTKWYVHGDPPIGVKPADDADEIDLDLSLEKYSLATDLLTKVLKSFVNDCDNLTIPQILNEGAIDRLVLASGGLARDYFAILRRAVDVARERGEGHRGPTIGFEDVNVAAGEHEPSKREELKRDVLEDR